jgi:hypothetical protein
MSCLQDNGEAEERLLDNRHPHVAMRWPWRRGAVFLRRGWAGHACIAVVAI